MFQSMDKELKNEKQIFSKIKFDFLKKTDQYSKT